MHSVFDLLRKKVLSDNYFFTPKYLVDLEQSEIFSDPNSKWQRHLKKKKIYKDHHDYFQNQIEFISKHVQVRLTDKGHVNMLKNTQI